MTCLVEQQAGPQADRCAEEGDDDDQRLLPPQNGYELAKVDFVFSNYGGGGGVVSGLHDEWLGGRFQIIS